MPEAMEKAYDLKNLLKRFEARGLVVVETQLGGMYADLKAWATESAALSSNKVDDVIAPFLSQLDAVVLPLIDKVSDEVETKA